MTFYELKEFLDLKAEHYQSQEFITADPIQLACASLPFYIYEIYTSPDQGKPA